MIIIKIMERDMIVTTTSRVTSGSVNLPVKFHFKGDEWDDLVKTAVFIGSGEERDVALITDECAVPADVLAEAGGDLKIGVYGRLANGATVIPTIWGRVQYIYEGTEMSEPSPHDPEPDWTAQVQQAAATALTKATAVEEAAARGDFDGVSPEVTIAEITHGHSVAIADRDHPEGQSFNVMDGASAYEQAVAGGYTGTEAQFNAELAAFKDLSEETKESAPFYAEYGVTTKAEIQAAINGKRQIYLHHGNLGGIVAPYTGTFLYADIWGEGTGYGFALTNGNFQYVYELKSEWTYSIYDLTAPAQRAETAAAAAASSKTAAEDSATAAASSATAAAGSASDAATAKTAAEAAQTAAAASAADASDSADSAASSATAASGSATAAASSATAAGNAQTAAETAQGAAEDAQAAAEAVLASIPEDYTELTEDVDNLKSAVTLYTGNAEIDFIKDKYIVTSGDTVDITSPVNSSTGYGYAVIDCSEGDKFTVTSSGGTNPRAWCFIDASGNSLTKADAGVSANNTVITAPANTAKLVINAKYATEKSYYGEFLANRLEDLNDAFENRDPLFNKIIKLPNNDSFFEGKTTNAGIYTKLGNNVFEISGGTGTTYYNYPIHGTKRVVVGVDAQMSARVLPEDFIEIPTDGDWRSTTYSLGIKMYIESTVSTGSAELVIMCANIINGEFVDTPVVLARGQVNAKYGTCMNRLRDTGFVPFEKYTHYAIFARSKNRSTGNSTKIYLETVQSPRALSNTLNSASMVETSMKATRNYAVNSLIIIETKLYKVISAISSGEDIIVGTNVQETTILGTLTYLLNRI